MGNTFKRLAEREDGASDTVISDLETTVTGLVVSLYTILFHFRAVLWESIILLLPPPNLQRLPYCTTIVRPLRNMRPGTDLPFVWHTPYNIDDGNIV